MKTWAIVVAAGAGERLGAGEPKAFRSVGGRRLFAWSVEELRAHPHIDRVVLVVPAGLEFEAGAESDALVVAGGSSRAASVAAGLAVTPDDVDVVLIHDAARPLLSRAVIDRCIKA
ncbi:MAG TPA: 2-C-methyl-D-erythritol 4-phosphate cytidylyltransferase, partial [Actinomycetota bacterium]|nr:2-C-methyl-D-erythritol 4-phosphate cytidylyltransferase [Actinomycetota bacterium]